VAALAALASRGGFTGNPGAVLVAPLLALEFLLLARGITPFALAPLAALWANLDGESVLLAPLVFAAWRIGEALERAREGAGERARMRRDAAAGFLVLAAACLNPALHRVLASPLGLGSGTETLGGMPGGPPTPSSDTAFYLLMAVLVPAAAFGLRSLPLPALASTVLLLAPALASRSLVPFAGLASLLVLPPALGAVFPRIARASRPLPYAGLSALLAVVLVLLARGKSPGPAYPGDALAALDGALPGGEATVLAPRPWGGFIEERAWPRLKPFIDPRGRVFGDREAAENWQVLEDAPDSGEILARRRPDLVLAGQGTRLGRRLARDRGFALVFWDDDSVAYARRGGALDRAARERAYSAFNPDAGPPSPVKAVLVDLARAVRESPRCHLAHSARSSILARTGRLSEAWTEAVAAVELAPGRADPALDAFDLALARRDREGANRMLSLARAADPRGPGPRAAAATLVAAEGRPADALRAALDAVREAEGRSERASDPGLARALRLVARIRAAGRETGDAADALRRAGNVMMAAGDPWAALADYRLGLKLAPRDPRLAHNAGAALYELGLLKEALDAWREALVLNPGSVETLVAAGVACYRLADHAGARRAWSRALTLDPRRNDVRGLLMQLEAKRREGAR
jgi:tetratricopeptide (TPR) repeat protein